MSKQIRSVHTADAPQAIGPYSQAVVVGDFLFLSGQIPVDPKVNKIVGPAIEEQTKQVLDNIEAILKVEGLDLKNVVRADVYLKDMHDFAQMNTVYAGRFNHEPKPARTTIQAAKLPMDCLIEITCIAYKQN